MKLGGVATNYLWKYLDIGVSSNSGMRWWGYVVPNAKKKIFSFVDICPHCGLHGLLALLRNEGGLPDLMEVRESMKRGGGGSE